MYTRLFLLVGVCIRWLVFLVLSAVVRGEAIGATPLGADAAAAAAEVPQFERDILPLLEAKCFRCHGEDTRKAELDLRTVASMLQGGESGPAIVAGKPDDSPLYQMIHDGLMPPESTPDTRLSDLQVQLIHRWIERGAAEENRPSGKVERDDPAQSMSVHTVLPILLRNCTVCHGAHVREADLDLRTLAGMLKGGKSGAAIVPGDAENSLLVRRITVSEMPPLKQLIAFGVKPITPNELAAIRQWVDAGAPEGDWEPDIASTEPDPLVTDADRQFWAFQSPQVVAIPRVQGRAAIGNPIDAFVLQQLESHGLTFSPESDRATLMRRATFDLLGLPPSAEEVVAYLADTAPDAYERWIERLLASPRYGERWGRHWLDVVGYADSDGKREQDLFRQYGWRYRDYVVRAYNQDKSHDRFLLEQLAGDELAPYEPNTAVSPEVYDNLVATGFMRMAPDPTWAGPTNFVPDRLDVIADQMDILGSAVMGLTLKCARCHSHKFDPIPQRDYYRLTAVFKAAFDEYDWLKSNWEARLSKGIKSVRELPVALPHEVKDWQDRKTDREQKIAAAQSALETRKREAMAVQVERRLADKVPEELREAVRIMLRTPPDQRDRALQDLAARYEKELSITDKELAQSDMEFAQFEAASVTQTRAWEAEITSPPSIRGLWDRGDPSPTYMYRRGDYLTPGRIVGPGVPSVLTDGRTPFRVEPPHPGAKSTGRRLAFARWIVREDHPLTTRVYINRVWKHHFGSGLVRTLDNFGRAGAKPSHPELLDWLAREFMRGGRSTKHLHRLLMTSATYRQSSSVTPALAAKDPDNSYWSRMPMQRLSSDQLYDALLVVANRLVDRPGGRPDLVEVRNDGLSTPRAITGGWRRSLYVRQQRKIVATHFEVFDFPAMNPNCPERRDSTVALQALHLWNDALVQTLSDSFARELGRPAGATARQQVALSIRSAYGREATEAELQAGARAIGQFADQWLAEHAADGLARDPQDTQQQAQQHALSLWCHALVNSAEFLYVD